MNLEKIYSQIFISFTGIFPSGHALLVLTVFFTSSSETGRKPKEEIFFVS